MRREVKTDLSDSPIVPGHPEAMIRVVVATVVAILAWVALLPVLVLSGMLLLFASCVHAIARLMEPTFVSWKALMTFDQGLGWRPRPGLDAHYLATGDDVFRLVTDREGWAGTRSMEESAVVVIGDSFASGYGIDTGSSFADLNPKVAIKGVGAPGYSMVQSVLLMEQLAERLTGKLVVWFVCLENDIEDNLVPAMGSYRSPFVRPSRPGGGWEMVRAHVAPSPWLCPVSDKRLLPHLCVPGPIADRAYAGCDYLIGLGAAACGRVGASLVLVTIPDPSQLTVEGRAKLAALAGGLDSWDGDLPDKQLAASCKRHGVPIIVGKDHLSAVDYKPLEGLHWNSHGHRRMADLLGRVYESFSSGGLGTVVSTLRPTPRREALAMLDESPAGLR
jgi:hypothetical protein